MEISTFIILAVVGLGTGFINTVAGGGSLITLPILMFLGLPHTVANGTNRVGILVQSISGLAGFKSKSVTSFPTGFWQGIISMFGAFIGVKLALIIDATSFNYVLSAIMVVVAILLIIDPKNKDVEIDYHSKPRVYFSLFLFFFVGIYGGFIQAGLGFIIVPITALINGFSIHKSNHAKAFTTLCISMVAFTMFFFDGQIVWSMGIVLAIFSSIGAWVASRWSVSKEEKTIKVLLVVMVCILSLKLLFPTFFDNIFSGFYNSF